MSRAHGPSDPGASGDNQVSGVDFSMPPDSTMAGSWTLEHLPSPDSLQQLWDAAVDPLWQQNINWTPRDLGDAGVVPGSPTLGQLEQFGLAPYVPAVPCYRGNEDVHRRITPIDLSEGEEHHASNKLWPSPNPSQREAMEWYSGQILPTPDAARHAVQRYSLQPGGPKSGREVKIPRASQKNEVVPLLQEEAEKPFKCPDCPARFARKRDCERHRRSVHTGSKAYHCKGCREGFVRSDGRGRHWKLSPECHQSHIQLAASNHSSPSAHSRPLGLPDRFYSAYGSVAIPGDSFTREGSRKGPSL